MRCHRLTFEAPSTHTDASRMNHLSGMDASLLHFETPEMPMHVGSLQILDLPAGYTGDFHEDVKRYVAGRMHLADVFQRKPALMPFELANPVWVDDDDLDIDYHVRHVIPPRPGTWVQLERYVARLHSGLRDRSRPLWETYVIEGLATGRMAIHNKMHHAAIDGQAGVAVTKALLGDSAVPAPIKPPRPRPRTNQYRLGVSWLMSGAASLYGRSRLAERLPPIVNVAISNVPGPQYPLYFAGAKLAGFYPVSIPAHGVALNMTVQSYTGALEVGLTACRRAMPDVTDLADHVVHQFELLRSLIDALEPRAPVAAVAVAPPADAAVVPARKRTRPSCRPRRSGPAPARCWARRRHRGPSNAWSNARSNAPRRGRRCVAKRREADRYHARSSVFVDPLRSRAWPLQERQHASRLRTPGPVFRPRW